MIVMKKHIKTGTCISIVKYASKPPAKKIFLSLKTYRPISGLMK
jgi:hypothetical protein